MKLKSFISVIKDKNIEITNDVDNSRWNLAGVCEEQKGNFFYREGENSTI